MAAILFLVFPRAAEFMEKDISRLRKRLPKPNAPVFHTDRSRALLIPGSDQLEQIVKSAGQELEKYSDWSLIELGRRSNSKYPSGPVESWMNHEIRFKSGEQPLTEEDYDRLAEEYRTT